MHISTIYEGTLIEGVVLKHSSFYLEVRLTSPYSNFITSRSVPYFARQHTRYEGDALHATCTALLIELYQVANYRSDADKVA